MPCPQGGRDNQFIDLLADDGLAFVAKSCFRLRIEFDNLSLVIDRDNGIQRRVENRCLARLAIAESFFGLATLSAYFGLAQLALNRRHQPLDIALHQVVAGAGLHDFHRKILADTAGNDQERNVQAR